MEQSLSIGEKHKKTRSLQTYLKVELFIKYEINLKLYCMYICMCIYIYVCMCICLYMYVCIYICMHSLCFYIKRAPASNSVLTLIWATLSK